MRRGTIRGTGFTMIEMLVTVGVGVALVIEREKLTVTPLALIT